MDVAQFWPLIERAGKASDGDQSAMIEHLRESLAALPAEDVRGFRLRLEQLMGAAYTWDLWGAAYLMNGGCSDDGFEYWRAWLIAQGRAVYEAALKDPDSLADAPLVFGEAGDFECESLLYVALEVYEEATGQEMSLEGVATPEEPAGEPWDEDSDELEKRLPKLARAYL